MCDASHGASSSCRPVSTLTTPPGTSDVAIASVSSIAASGCVSDARTTTAFPPTIGELTHARGLSTFFSPNGTAYIIGESVLIVLFTYFYTAVTFNPVEQADNLKKYGGFIPGVRPGRPTAEVLDRVRAATPRDQTGSAGVARWDTEEPAELLFARCLDALVAAKEAGRNLTIAAD